MKVSKSRKCGCGRDWEKAGSKYVSSNSRIYIWLHCLPALFSLNNVPREDLAHSVFDGMYAETIRYIYKQCCFEGKRVSLRRLRKLFKSVYD